MDICGTDNLLELKQGQAGPAGSDGSGEVTEILSIRGALSIPYVSGNASSPISTNGLATHTFSEIIRTKTVADPSGVFRAIVSGNFALGSSGDPNGNASITLTNFLNVDAKLFTCHLNLNAFVNINFNTTVTSGTVLPAITESEVGKSTSAVEELHLNIINIDENEIIINVFDGVGNAMRWRWLLNNWLRGFYYSLTIFAVKD